MLEREIGRNDVKRVLLNGEIIEVYSGDSPYPSVLMLGFIESKPLHVVAAVDGETNWCFIITAYRPDLEHFEQDYKTRKNE